MIYTPPVVETIEVLVEHGFAGSDGDGMKLPEWDFI